MADVTSDDYMGERIAEQAEEIDRLTNDLEELQAGVAAFRAMVVRAPVMLEAEDWERWYRRLMTVMDRTGHMVTWEAHERAQAFLPDTEGVDDA